MAVLWLNKCVTQMHGTEVPDSIRFLPPQRQMQADTADQAVSKSHWGAGSACLNVCVIKGTLRLQCLQLPDAKAAMNDFNLAKDENWLLTLL